MEDIPRMVVFISHVVGFCASLAMVVPMSLLQQNFQRQCPLYASGEWHLDSESIFLNVSSWGPVSNCVFPQFVGVSFIIAAALYMGWTLYVIFKNLESTWCATFTSLTVSGAFAVLQLIAAACISEGLNEWCDLIVESPSPYRHCSAADQTSFQVIHSQDAEPPIATIGFFTLMKTAEVSSWFAWLAYIAATLASIVALKLSERSSGGSFLSSLRNERDRLVKGRFRGSDGYGPPGRNGQGYSTI